MRSGAHRFAPVRSEPAARWLLEPGRTALVTFRTGSRGPLAALIPHHEFICVARRTPPRPCDTRGRRRGPCQAASTRGLRAGLWHPAANGCPRGLGPAAALPTSLLTTTGSGAAEVASAPVRYGHDRKPRGWRLIPAASCRARAGGTWRVPPANVAVAHRPTVGRFPCGCIAQSGGTSIPRAAAPWAVGGRGGWPLPPQHRTRGHSGELLRQQKFTLVFTVLNFQVGLDILHFQTLRSEHQGLIPTQSQRMDTKNLIFTKLPISGPFPR